MRHLTYPHTGRGTFLTTTMQSEGYCTVLYRDLFLSRYEWPSYSELIIFGPEHFQ